jgi:ribosomal protein S17E
MTEEEHKVPRSFLKALADFNREREMVFKEFDEIQDKYTKGEDIVEDLKQFKSKRPGIFVVIDDIFHKAVEVEHKLNQEQVKEEEREVMQEFKDRFSDLAEAIDLLVLEELVASR